MASTSQYIIAAGAMRIGKRRWWALGFFLCKHFCERPLMCGAAALIDSCRCCKCKQQTQRLLGSFAACNAKVGHNAGEESMHVQV